MTSISGFIQQVILVGLVLLNLGKLTDVTSCLAREVAMKQSRPFSIGKFNRALHHKGDHGLK